jgi:hypothetical protein
MGMAIIGIFLLKTFPESKEYPKIRSERGGVSYINARKKKVSGRRSGLRLSEKELPGRHSDEFCHKNTPSYNVVNTRVMIDHCYGQ